MNRYGIEKVRGGRFNSTEVLSKSIISKYFKRYHIPSSIYEEHNDLCQTRIGS